MGAVPGRSTRSLDVISEIVNIATRQASPIFLGWALGSAAVVVVSLIVSAMRALPSWLEPAFFTCIAGVAMTGTIVAAAYILSALWMRARVLSGILALGVNAAFLWLVLMSPQLK